MSAEIIDGKKIAEQIYSELSEDIEALKEKDIIPKLTVILVGNDQASAVYVRMKGNACKRVGIVSETLTFDADISEEELLAIIDRLNQDASCHGILVQMPLPDHIDENKVIERIWPEKDVDGFHPVNKGRLQAGLPCFVPCTPAGVQEILVRSGYSPEGKHVVVIGRSQIVGMPLAILLAKKQKGANATVTICHSRTQNVDFFTKNADIIVAAMGRPQTITAEMLNPDAVVIDVGVNRVEDPQSEKGYRLVGDVDFDAAVEHVKAITPVPGGVGPLTIAMLMKNTVLAAEKSLFRRQ
ncbi:MAG: tetrahydrofolate dehydrogenase/cyclohydrolase catalytic domain-containing protein [candidate division KSB1 bacterium]|nr:tetrahydrofolate dehydrogenase/cyclohydrolase catalytic domain-containing protein [candidate division KSB1 bacterium]MDQ7062714.1 tetrahydrofolate dehydrogenase/cyclohydrolase catalytic domain-containing protein [candidate division KSB1 bacterium]